MAISVISRAAVLLFFSAVSFYSVHAHPEINVSDDNSTVTVGDAPDQEVYTFGKAVIVTRRAKGVLAVGGDVTIEGRVEGDVAAIGGNVIQRNAAYIGGDVIVIGGSYRPETLTPEREAGKQTVVFGMMEDELRDMAQNPSHILSPSFSITFVAQRLILALVWFVISLGITTIAPGAIGRAATRLNLGPLKVCAIGSAAFLLSGIVMVVSAAVLPNFLGACVIGLCLLLFLFGYVLGRIALHVSLGKLIQRRFFPENNRSETLAILTGVVIWTFVLSIPYVWPIALFATFALGIGLVLTGRVARGPQLANAK